MAYYRPEPERRQAALVQSQSALLFIDVQNYNCSTSGALYGGQANLQVGFNYTQGLGGQIVALAQTYSSPGVLPAGSRHSVLLQPGGAVHTAMAATEDSMQVGSHATQRAPSGHCNQASQLCRL